MENIDKTPQSVVEEENNLDTSSEDNSYEESTEETTEESQGPSVDELQQQLADKDAEIAKFKRMAERASKKKPEAKAQSKQNTSDELDYGQKAYLQQNGVEENFHDFVQSELENSGLRLEELLKNGYFQSKLQEQRDKVAVAQATPSGTRVSTEPAQSKAEYWVKKGELPPDTPENRKLRQEVVNLRYEREKGAQGGFSTQSVIG